jgi:hypothetical protein
MSLKAAFDKIPEGHRQYAAVMLRRAMSIASPLTEIGTLPSLDEVFNLLGRSITRKEMLKELQKRLNDSMNNSFIVRKIEGIHDLIECCEKETDLLNKMVRAMLAKEVPHVKPGSESVDVPVQLQSN